MVIVKLRGLSFSNAAINAAVIKADFHNNEEKSLAD